VRIIKEMPGSVASGTHCTFNGKLHSLRDEFQILFVLNSSYAPSVYVGGNFSGGVVAILPVAVSF
jgi:hypothetical protein